MRPPTSATISDVWEQSAPLMKGGCLGMAEAWSGYESRAGHWAGKMTGEQCVGMDWMGVWEMKKHGQVTNDVQDIGLGRRVERNGLGCTGAMCDGGHPRAVMSGECRQSSLALRLHG